jgi:hypothetical protein
VMAWGDMREILTRATRRGAGSLAARKSRT